MLSPFVLHSFMGNLGLHLKLDSCISFSFCIFKTFICLHGYAGSLLLGLDFLKIMASGSYSLASVRASCCTGLCGGTQALGMWALVVVMHGLDLFTGYGIFLDQEIKPLSPGRQVDS